MATDPTRRRPADQGDSMKKANLPTKVCAACGRPFAWRKKWAKDWEQVRYCSDKCRKSKPTSKGEPSP
jgi:hypothetical protein